MKNTNKKEQNTSMLLWIKLVRAFTYYNNLSSADLRKYQLTQAQYDIIDTLGRNKILLIGDLTKKHFVSGGNTTIVLKNLESMGLIKRTVCKTDKRKCFVQLTKKGKNIFDKSCEPHSSYLNKLASSLTLQEQKSLSGLLDKLSEGMLK